ncbi:hypothetical protein GXB81_01775 [Paraburkholderia sp. Ac-20336]|uniref:DUF4286 family protein n=1 Tax=Paraburkholderia sp. Ac-20336 TaxID=2703886 RepID=UPI00197F9166|nr:DUF4286 family protein [Paraburkholderia sp. Ac-20336]MBN3801792.1 hypothetical protein [Paraburkholderia sp. Ac-20336]
MSLLGSAFVLIWNDIVEEARADFYEWHNKDHIPERLSIDGFLRGRRYRGARASPEWLTVYEAVDLDTLTGPAYLERLNNPAPSTQANVKHFRNTARSICQIEHSTGDSTGAYAITLQLRVEEGAAKRLIEFVAQELFPRILKRPDVVAAHLFAADTDASNVKTTEAQHRGGAFAVPSRVLLIECTTEHGASETARALGDVDWQQYSAAGDPCQIYTLEISRLGQSR